MKMKMISVLMGFWGFVSILIGSYLANLGSTMFESRPIISVLILGLFGMITLIIGYALGAHLVKTQVSEEDVTEE